MVNTVTADMREGEAMNKEHSVRHLDSRCDSYLDEFVVELYLFEALWDSYKTLANFNLTNAII